MNKKMNVAVMTDIGKIGWEERSIPQISSEEALIKVEYVGVCGSDLHYYESGAIGDFIVEPPFVLGHEAAGTVVEIGVNVKHLKVGDRVAIEPGKPCRQCEYCMRGLYNLCPDVIFLATPPVDGAFQDYLAHDARLCFKLPEQVETLEGALIEPLAVGFHAAAQGGACVGQTAVIMGAGCIGLMTLLALKANGVTDIYVADYISSRLKKALESGARGVIDLSEKDIVEEISRLTENQGCDLVLETSGSESATNQCIDMARRGSNIVLVGYDSKGGRKLDVDKALNKELTFKTVFRYRHVYPTVIKAVASGAVNLKSIVSNIYNFSDIQTAMDACLKNKSEIIKAVIKMD